MRRAHFLVPLALLLFVAWFVRTESPAGLDALAPEPTAPQPAARASSLVAARQDRGGFERPGGTLVTSAAPGVRLEGLDPALVDGHEADLRAQLATTTPRPDQARNVGEIARRAHSPELRFAAVDALGRTRGDDARDELLSLLTDGSIPAGEPAHRAIAPALRPSGLADPFAARMARLLDAREVEPGDKGGIAFTLSLLAARDGSALPADVVAPLSPDARSLLASAAARVRAPRPTGDHP
jgi:hypothetical protein